MSTEPAPSTNTFATVSCTHEPLSRPTELLADLPNALALQALHQLDPSSSDFEVQFCDLLNGEEYMQCVPHLQGGDLVWLVDHLDKVLDPLDPSGAAFRKGLRELRDICGTRAILPTSYALSPQPLVTDPNPFASGGFADAYRGTLNGSGVCIKRLRMYRINGPQKVTEAFCKEAVVWKRLAHPNIVPLLGITVDPLQFVSEWMSGRGLREYIENNSDADRVGLLSDIARGLCYLHLCNVIHGDLKGSNVLIDSSGRARIADLGLAMLIKDEEDGSSEHGHTPRWTAPEVLDKGKYNKEADIFSFAMVMFETFTGAIPFSGESAVTATMLLLQGKRPPQPTHPTFTDRLWTLMQRCWNHDPHLRPAASEVLEIILIPVEPRAWKRLISHTVSVHERVSLTKSIFSNPNVVELLGHLSGDDAQAFIDVMDEVLNNLPQRTPRLYWRSLSNICDRQALLPKSLVIPLCHNPMETPRYSGGFADVWKGRYRDQEVAVKVLRVGLTSDLDQIRRRFCKEVAIWRTLRHPNVLPLVGVTVTETRFMVASEWMENGNINMFVKANTDADRLQLLEDITRALMYMHGLGIVHGNLDGANILVRHNGRAHLDFSLPTVISDQLTLAAYIEAGKIPWMSPELLDPGSFGLKNCRLTKESDRYALGMVVFEILSGQAPFAPVKAPVPEILRGERPERPEGVQGVWFTDSVWEMLVHCWSSQPDDRPSLNTVLRCLQDDPLSSSYVEVDVEADADDQSDVTTTRSSDLSVACRANTHRPSGSGLPTAHHDNSLQVLQSPPGVPPDSGLPLPDPSETGNPKRGGIVQGVTGSVRGLFKTVTSFGSWGRNWMLPRG